MSSIYDENLGNHVVSLENFQDVSEDYLLRAPKKGKLIKGPNWTAYKRENLGTIPRKTEKVIIKDQTIKPQLGFSSQTERFSKFGRTSPIKPNNPGPGQYELSKDFNTTSSSISSKGLGNGFISAAERFNETKLYYDKYYPGPGQYKAEDKTSIKYDLENNIQYRSLYDKTENKSLKTKQDQPGPGYYNITHEGFIIENKLPLSAFKSNVVRFKRDNKSAFPGPGKYFKQTDNNLFNDEDKKGNTLSYFFKQPMTKKEDPINKFINNYDYDKVLKIQPKSAIRRNNLKEFLSTTKSKFNFANRNHSANPNLNLNKSKSKHDLLIKNATISQNIQEAQYIKDVLGKTQKRPLFELSPPRWNDKLNHIPGPAYYNPSLGATKNDFYNDNLRRWLK